MCRYAISVHISNGAPHPRRATTNNFFLLFFKTSNGAPWYSAPLLFQTTNGAPQPRCATTNKFFVVAKLVMAHHATGEPLVTRVTNGAPGLWCAITSFEKIYIKTC